MKHTISKNLMKSQVELVTIIIIINNLNRRDGEREGEREGGKTRRDGLRE